MFIRNAIATVMVVAVFVMSAAASVPPSSGGYPATLHERLSGGCELIQQGTLLQHDDFVTLKLERGSGEIYSSQLDKRDFLVVDKKESGVAKGSGFHVRTEPMTAGDLPRTAGEGCPVLAEALKDAEQQRSERLKRLQSRPYQVGGDVTPPKALEQPQPPAAKAPNDPRHKRIAKQGTVILIVWIGVDGSVYNAKIQRSLDADLDQKALEAVRKWRFLPARKNGAPVPVQINVEVNFRLY